MPAPLRCVVTGLDSEGRSTIKDDAPATRFYEFERLGGSGATAIWEVQTPITVVTAGGDPVESPLTLEPPPGGLRFFRYTMPPHSWADKDQNAVLAEMAAKAPTLLAAMDPKRGLGMHKTDTIDLGFIVSGAVDLAVETGQTTLRAGDAYVQSGTWHAWHNPYNEPCVFVVAMLRKVEKK